MFYVREDASRKGHNCIIYLKLFLIVPCIKKSSLRSKQPCKVVFTVSQFALCPALNETPGCQVSHAGHDSLVVAVCSLPCKSGKSQKFVWLFTTAFIYRGTNLPLFKIYSFLFLVSIMYNNTFKTKENNILTKDKSEPQRIYKDMLWFASFKFYLNSTVPQK